MALDVEFARSQFPSALWQYAFFENAGGAFVPNAVVARMTEYMMQNQVQPGYPTALSQQAQERMNKGHQLMAEMIGAQQQEVTIGPSTSINIYVLAQALRHLWKAGDEIVVSTLNHESNSGPWRRLAEFGLKVVEWPVTGNAELDMHALKDLLNDKTRLLAFPQVSNITGELNDVASITSLAHENGALVCVDGVAAAPHRLADVKTWDVDFYLFSFYKVFGPHLGCMYGKRELLLQARGQYHYFFPEDDLLHKLNPSGPNHESMAALVGIADYFDALCSHHGIKANVTRLERTRALYELIAEHEEQLAEPFIEWVKANSLVRLIGPATAERGQRVPTFSFQVAGKNAEDIARRLAADKIAIGFGHFYAKRLLDSIGLEDGVARCSMAHYNTQAEVAHLLSALDRAIA